jgi:hypothetical protein
VERRDAPTVDQIDAAEALVRAAGAVALGRLPGVRTLTPTGEAALLVALTARGLEVVPRGRKVRVPPVVRLRRLLAEGGYLALDARLKARIGASTAAEVTAAALRLVADGEARLALRTKVLTLVPLPARDLLSEGDVAALEALHRTLGLALAALRRARGRGASARAVSLLRADAAALLAPVAGLGTPAPRPAPAPVGRPLLETLGEILTRLADPASGLTFVPALAAALEPGTSRDTWHAALLHLASAGQVELRPESGLRLLSAADRSACPAGPQGTVLSWVRWTGPAVRP